MSDKAPRVEMTEAEPETAPESVANSLTLDAFCRNIAQSIPAETLSVFYTTEIAAGRSRGTFDEFAKRLHDFQNAALG